MFKQWKIGDKNLNNGALFLIAIGDGQLRIETGYGTEGFIPDTTAYTIIKNTTSYFPKGDKTGKPKAAYQEGIMEGFKEINGYYVEGQSAVPKTSPFTLGSDSQYAQDYTYNAFQQLMEVVLIFGGIFIIFVLIAYTAGDTIYINGSGGSSGGCSHGGGGYSHHNSHSSGGFSGGGGRSGGGGASGHW